MMKQPVLLSLLLLQAGTALADSSIEQVIVTATQQPVNVADMPLDVSILHEQDLAIVQHVHINEVFQRVSGGWISRGNGQESLTAIRSPVLTGAGSCGAFFMAADGISLRAPGFCNVNQLFDANSEQAGRIEVIKGPATALYGSGAMHGLINVITPEPTADPSHRLGAGFGPHGYWRARYQGSAQFDNQGLLLAVNVANDDGYKDSSGFEQGKLSLRHTLDADNFSLDTIFSATDLDQDTAGFIQGYKAYQDDDLKKSNPNPDAYRESRSARLQSRLALPLGDDDKIVITPYWRDTEMEFLQHFLPWQSTEENGHESFGVTGKWYHQATWVKIVSGMDIDLTEGWLLETQDEPFSPNQPQGVHYDYTVDAVTLAAYSQVDWDLARNWQLSGGLRYEQTNYDYRNQAGDGPACDPGASACRFYRPADREDDFDNLSLNIGVLWDYRPDHAVFARLSRGFRAPEAAELYRLQSGQAVADLDSEALTSVELGFRGGDTLSYELVAYYMEKEDVIFQDADRRNVSGAETLHYGLDLSLRWQLPAGFDLAADATLQRHEYDSNINLLGAGDSIEGNLIDTSPEHFGSLRLGWDFRPGYRAELEWVHMAEYFLEPDNRHRYDGHDLLNLRVTSQFSDALQLGLRLTNLSDEDYAERADFGFGQYRYFVGEERALYADIEYRWP